MTHQVIYVETAPSAWKSLYKVGGAAALIGVAIVPIQMVVFIAWPPLPLDWANQEKTWELAAALVRNARTAIPVGAVDIAMQPITTKLK